jgi:TRAP-type C4-dicarboxylate transport system permease small subunit
MPNSILYLGLPVAGVLIIMYTLVHLFDKDGLFIIKSMDTEDID